MITFNHSLKLVLADVDETIADVYTDATPEMIDELNSFIAEGRVLFLVSGGGLQSIRERIVDKLRPDNRHRVLIAHCSGAEVWGFEKGGEIKSTPYYGVYDQQFSPEAKIKWREVINDIIEKFHLKTYPTQPKPNFIKTSNADPLAIMLADRGPQITLEFTNSTNLTLDQKVMIEKTIGIKIPLHHETYDLRYPVMDEITKLYETAHLPVLPHFGGMFALDSIINGVDKTRAVKHVLEDETILAGLGLSKKDIDHTTELEIWGDKFSQKKGGPDFQMCLAVSPQVRTLDFRPEEQAEIPAGYNIQLWDGDNHLHAGLLEYLQTRHR